MPLKLTTVAVAFASLGAVVGLIGFSTGSGAEASGCHTSYLKGQYGFTVTGTAFVPPAGPMEEIVGIAMTTFDGAGHFTQVDNHHGAITGVITERAGSGTYSVNADCTGTMTLNLPGVPFPIQLRIVVVDKGHEVRTAVMAGPNLVTSVGKSTK